MSIPAVTSAGSYTQSQSTNKIKHQAVKYTGYGALALGVTSGIAAKNKKIKFHTKLAYAAGILSLAHLGIVEWFAFQKNKKA